MTASTEGQDQFVTVNALRIHYREWGAQHAPSLVVLHGAAGFARGLDGVAAALAERFHIVAPDLRGHGETAWAADYALDRFVEDAEQLPTTWAWPGLRSSATHSAP